MDQFGKVEYEKRGEYLQEEEFRIKYEGLESTSSSVQSVRQINEDPMYDFAANTIFIKNMPGRHLLVRYLKNVITTLPRLYPGLKIPYFQIVITKGYTLMDVVNSTVKEVLWVNRTGNESLTHVNTL